MLSRSMEPVLLFAPVGPYTDPISQLIWALYRQRNMAVVEAHVVADKRGLFYLENELLKPGRVLDQLREKIGTHVLGHDDFHTYRARLPDGSMLQDDLLPEHAKIYLDTMWAAARGAIRAANARRVIFGLLAGRRRSYTAYQSAFFQLLARERDLLLDVRVSDPRVHGFEFFFPEQEQAVEIGEKVSIDPRSVEVLLVELPLPKLAGLIADIELDDFASAIEAGQRAIDGASPPQLCVDLAEGNITVDEARVPLSAAELLWYAYLVDGRAQSDQGWVRVGQDSHDALRRFIDGISSRAWVASIRTRPLLLLKDGAYVSDEDLRNLRGKTVQRMKQWCEAQKPGAVRWLVPQSDGGRHQRIPLPAAHIQIRR